MRLRPGFEPAQTTPLVQTIGDWVPLMRRRVQLLLGQHPDFTKRNRIGSVRGSNSSQFDVSSLLRRKWNCLFYGVVLDITKLPRSRHRPCGPVGAHQKLVMGDDSEGPPVTRWVVLKPGEGIFLPQIKNHLLRERPIAIRGPPGRGVLVYYFASFLFIP